MKRLGWSLVLISCLAAPAGAQTPEPDTRAAVIEQKQADKATKLQTIFDRIELVSNRFEVLKREAEVDMLRAKLDALEHGDEESARRAEVAYAAKVRTYN